jgi:hypothetical protein
MQGATDDTDEEAPSSHRSARSLVREAEEDKAYVPTPAVGKRSALEGDELPAHDLDWEAASLAWCLAALGGLASACSGVFGGEYISR